MMAKTDTPETIYLQPIISLCKQLQLRRSNEEGRPLGISYTGEAEHKIFKGT